jgi:hypothetical protein
MFMNVSPFVLTGGRKLSNECWHKEMQDVRDLNLDPERLLAKSPRRAKSVSKLSCKIEVQLISQTFPHWFFVIPLGRNVFHERIR